MSESKASDSTKRDSESSEDRRSPASHDERTSRKDMSQMIEVGKGSFGRILIGFYAGGSAFKQTLNPRHVEELKLEFEIYRRIAPPLKKATFKVPKPLKFYSSVEELQARYEVKLDADGPLFSMRCVPSASVATSNVIRDNFVNERLRPKFVGLWLCRLYLGLDSTAFMTKRQRAAFMNTSNYPLCSKDIEFLRTQGVLPSTYTCSLIAIGMGEVLATFHHELKLDARDIEFVLGGGEEDDDLASLWVIDFNQVRPWQSIDDLVSAHLANDPYYPRPGSEFWSMFVGAYLTRSHQHIDAANAFIKALVEKERAKSQSNANHENSAQIHC